MKTEAQRSQRARTRTKATRSKKQSPDEDLCAHASHRSCIASGCIRRGRDKQV